MPRRSDRPADEAKPFDPKAVPAPRLTARATARQLWRLNRHDGYLARALAESGTNGEYVTFDKAVEIVAFLHAQGLPDPRD